MNKYRDFRRRDRNPNPASTARQTQRIDKNSSRTARRHKYSNKGRLRVVEPPSERFVSHMHTIWCIRLSARGYVWEQCKRKKLTRCLTKRNENRRFLSFSFAIPFFFSCCNNVSRSASCSTFESRSNRFYITLHMRQMVDGLRRNLNSPTLLLYFILFKYL